LRTRWYSNYPAENPVPEAAAVQSRRCFSVAHQRRFLWLFLSAHCTRQVTWRYSCCTRLTTQRTDDEVNSISLQADYRLAEQTGYRRPMYIGPSPRTAELVMIQTVALTRRAALEVLRADDAWCSSDPRVGSSTYPLSRYRSLLAGRWIDMSQSSYTRALLARCVRSLITRVGSIEADGASLTVRRPTGLINGV